MKIERRTDLNSITCSGDYYYPVNSKITNTPLGKEDTSGFLFVSEQDNGIIFQILISFGNLFSRQKLENGTWTPWMNLSVGAEAYILPIASDDELGGIKPGRGLSISKDGEANVDTYEIPIASETSIGGVRIGNNLSITKNGTLSANLGEKYKLPIASKLSLGGVKIGKNIHLSKDGTISVDDPLKNEDPFIIGSTLELTGNKILNVSKSLLEKMNSGREIIKKEVVQNNVENKYVLPIASNDVLGGIRIKKDNKYLSISKNGELKFNEKELPVVNYKPEEKKKTFTFEINNEEVNFSWSLEDQINFLSKVNIALMIQTGILRIDSDTISINDGLTDKEYNLSITELLNLFVNGFLA